METHVFVKKEIIEDEDEIKDTPDLVDPYSLQQIKSEFNCMICTEKFAHKLSLDIHEMLHNDTYFCFLCKTNYRPQNFPEHVRKMHMNLICNICNKVFGYKKAFKLHQNSHTKECIYKCDQCDKSFMQRGSLRTHKYSAHEGRKLECKICGGTFITSSSLNRHLKNMHSIKQLYCRICLEEFPDKKARNDHEVDHTKSKVCQECGVEYTKISSLTKHLTATHFRTEKCEYCKKLFHRLKLQTHIMAIHSPKECKICNRIFYTSRSFVQHCRSHSNKTIICKICRRRFKEPYMEKHLLQHRQNEIKKCNICNRYLVDMEKHDTLNHKNDKYYICRYCPRKFLTKVSLREHAVKGHRRRDSKNKHKCKICFKIFGSRYNLQRHYINHSTYRPYKCEVCLSQFKHPINLKRHEVTHTEKKFECKTCLRKFRLERTLIAHKCPGDTVACVVCEIKFGNDKNLKDHQVAMHSPRIVNSMKQGFNILEPYFHLNSMSNVNIIKTNSKKKYQCTKCKIVFAILENFKRHLCMKFVRKNYCVMCQRMFQSKQDWIRHAKLKHKNRDLRCKFCGLICNSSAGLRTHYVNSHIKKTTEPTGSNNNPLFEIKAELKGKLTVDKIKLQNDDIPLTNEDVVEKTPVVKVKHETVVKEELPSGETYIYNDGYS